MKKIKLEYFEKEIKLFEKNIQIEINRNTKQKSVVHPILFYLNGDLFGKVYDYRRFLSVYYDRKTSNMVVRILEALLWKN